MERFLSDLFGGSDPTLNKDQTQLGSLGGFSSNLGQNDTGAASNYSYNLLSNNPQAIAQTLAPEISAQGQQAQQQKATMAQFGSRSGGNTGAANAIDAQDRGNIVNLIGGAQQGAAEALGQLGTQNLGLAQNALTSQAGLSEEQLRNQQNSIFGGLLGGLGANVGQGITGGLGMIPGLSAIF